MPPSVPFRTLLEARSARALDVRDDGAVLVCSDLSGTMQLYLTDLDGGPLRPVVDLGEPVTQARFVPGTRDVVLGVDQGGDEVYQLRLVRDDGANLRDLAVAAGVRHLLGAVSRDGRLLAYACNRRNGTDLDAWVRDLRTGADRCVFEDGSNEVHDFSPDGRLLVVSRTGGFSYNSDLFIVDLVGGGAHHLTPHEGAAVSWFPTWVRPLRDGEPAQLLFATDIGREFAGIARWSEGADAWEYVFEPGWDCGVWAAPDGGAAVVATNDDGRTRLHLHGDRDLVPWSELSLPGGGIAFDSMATPSPIPVGDGSRVVVTFTSTGRPADVWRVATDGAPPRRLTRSPGEIPEALRRDPELVRVRSFDGLEVPAFVYRPRDQGAGPPPAVLFIHGGPESQFVPSFNPVILHLVDAGFAVVAPNVRGSTGYGKRYVHLDDVRLRLDSVRDLAAIHGWLEGAGLDPARAALVGGSYGGYMVLAGLAFQPELWAAGVSLVGISSLVTFLENTSAYRRHVREVEYGTLAADRDFLVEASPLTHVDRIRAPLLLVHGANDPRVPVGEAQQIERSLRERGVPVELIVYGDEGHGLARLANRLDAYPRMAEFLAGHLAP